MRRLPRSATLFLIALCATGTAAARVWTDSTGQYTLDADLIAFDDRNVVLRRADHELVALPLDTLSEEDLEYLKSSAARDAARDIAENKQTWLLRDGTELVGRLVNFVKSEITLQRRRGNIYVNDRRFDNLPEFYQRLIPQIVAHFENLRGSDRQTLETWLVRQRAQPRTFAIEGIVVEAENGDEYAVPFFLFSDDDLKLLQAGWEEWLAAHGSSDHSAMADHAFLLQSLAAAKQHDALVKREIALMQLNLKAVATGLTSLWEVTLHPAAGNGGPPRWVVVPGRDSRQATATALEQHAGYVAGPVRRVTRR